jgi:anti-sigma factor RsiW
MMTCKRIQRRLSAFLDRELPPAEARRIEQHLASCLACSREARTLGAAYELLALCPAALRAAVPDGTRRLWRPFVTLPIAAGLLTGAVLGLWFWPRLEAPVPAAPLLAGRALGSPRDVEAFGGLARDPLEEVYVTLTSPARR